MKKVVRLTESKLKEMIVEAVQETLNEMDFDGYTQAKKRHPQLMAQVDPRTFAARAKGQNAQRMPRKDDKETMRHAARSAWNDRYGSNDGKYNKYGDYEQDSLGMHGNNGGLGAYNIDRQVGTFRNGKKIRNGESAFYNPDMDKTYNASNGWKSNDGVGIDIPQSGVNIARQMATGKGKYTPNKGWED